MLVAISNIIAALTLSAKPTANGLIELFNIKLLIIILSILTLVIVAILWPSSQGSYNIHFSSRGKRLLYNTVKTLGMGASGTLIYNHWFKGGSSYPANYDDKKDDIAKGKDDKKSSEGNNENNSIKNNFINSSRAATLGYHLQWFPLILASLNLNVSESDTSITQLSHAVFILSLIALLSLVNIVGYILGYYLVNNQLINSKKYNNLILKYPILLRFINKYKKSTLFFIVIEFLLGFISLSILVIFSLLYVYSGINNR
jgi:hypothetical protein